MSSSAATVLRDEIDQHVITAFVAGDRQAFRVLFDRLNRDLFVRVVAKLFSRPFDQEEAMQEVWLQLYRVRHRFDVNRHAEFIGWARQVARNRCIDLLKARGRQQEVPVETMEPTDDARQLDALSDSRVRHALRAFVSGLDREQRQFFTLCFVEELSHDEIGQRLSITIRRSKYLKKKLLQQMVQSVPLRQVRR